MQAKKTQNGPFCVPDETENVKQMYIHQRIYASFSGFLFIGVDIILVDNLFELW